MIRACIVTFGLLCPWLAAAQTYDLRAASEERNVAGESILHEESEQQDMALTIKQGQQVLNDEREVSGIEQRYVEELLEVDAEGEILRARRTYSRFVDLQTKQELDGELIVTWTRAEDGTRAVEVPPDRTLPQALSEKLKRLAAPKDDEEQDEQDPKRIFTPAEPVAVGATWTVDPREALDGMGLEEELNPEASSCTGTLVSAQDEDGVTWLDVKVEISLELLTMEGVRCSKPFVWTMTLALRLPDGGGNAGKVTMSGRMAGSMTPPDAPADVVVDVNMSMRGDMRRTTP